MKIVGIIVVGCLVLAAGCVLAIRSGAWDPVPAAAINLAKVEVRERLRDLDVEFGEVTFRYIDPIKQGGDKSYVCGLLRQRGTGWRLFLWSDDEGRRDLMLAGGGMKADLLIADICGGAWR